MNEAAMHYASIVLIEASRHDTNRTPVSPWLRMDDCTSASMSLTPGFHSEQTVLHMLLLLLLQSRQEPG